MTVFFCVLMVSRTEMFYYFAIRTLVTCDDFEILSTALAVSFVIKKKKKAVLRAGGYYAKTKRHRSQFVHMRRMEERTWGLRFSEIPIGYPDYYFVLCLWLVAC